MAERVGESEALLEVNNIEVIYNHVILVLKGVSLSVPEGGITALLGGNGGGQDDDAEGDLEPAALGAGAVTKGETLDRATRVQDLPPSELVRLRRVYVGRRAADVRPIGRALMAKPETILLDEPSMGLAPQLVEEIFEIVRDLNAAEEVSFLLADQNTNVAMRFATYGYILESGRVVMDGTAEALRENPDVKKFYLGMSESGRKSFRDVRSYRRRKRWLSRATAGDAKRPRYQITPLRPLHIQWCGGHLCSARCARRGHFYE